MIPPLLHERGRRAQTAVTRFQLSSLPPIAFTAVRRGPVSCRGNGGKCGGGRSAPVDCTDPGRCALCRPRGDSSSAVPAPPASGPQGADSAPTPQGSPRPRPQSPFCDDGDSCESAGRPRPPSASSRREREAARPPRRGSPARLSPAHRPPRDCAPSTPAVAPRLSWHSTRAPRADRQGGEAPIYTRVPYLATTLNQPTGGALGGKYGPAVGQPPPGATHWAPSGA